MKKNIVLIGLMGAGKTSVGCKLADTLNYAFCDTDVLIEQEEKCKISQIFSLKGEEYFRKLENEIISKVVMFSETVISTGGGAVQNIENLQKLKKTGVLFYLKALPEVLFERVSGDDNRPLLKNENPLEVLCELLKKRENNYMLADVIIETDKKTKEDVVEEILKEYHARA